MNVDSSKASFGLCYTGTVECVFASDLEKTAQSVIFKMGDPAVDQGWLCCMWSYGSLATDFKGNMVAANDWPLEINKLTTIAATYNDVPSTSNAKDVYFNGVKLPRNDSAVSGGWAERGSGKTQLGYFEYSGVNWPYKGKIYAIRLYSRKLTDAEIAQNAKLDKQRFGNKGLVFVIR